MTNEQLEILCLIRAGHRTFRAIAGKMGVDHGFIYRQIEGVLAPYYVERTVDTVATLRLTEQGRQAVKGYFLTYKAGGGIILGRMVHNYVSDIDSGLTSRTRTGP